MRAWKARGAATMVALAATALIASQGASEFEITPFGADWEAFNKLGDGQRFSPLDQVDRTNVDKLVEVCRVQVGDRGTFESGPVVIGDAMFVTTPTDTFAIDPTDCRIRWRHSYTRSQEPMLSVNRGVAYYGGKVFRGTDDGRLIALDAATGREVWRNTVGDSGLGEYVAGAPIAWNGLVITGTSGSEYGVRGKAVAYDAESGREVWHFDTVPTGKQVGAESWHDSRWASHGGGGTWSSFALDPNSGELFIPVGNPVPDFAPGDRPGTNLFTNSALVLDARTGKLLWWYQITPVDSHDYDLGAAPMLFRNQAHAAMLAVAGKDGLLHVISRDTRKQLFQVPVTTVDGPPKAPTVEGVHVCPGANGGVLWNGPAFDPLRQTIYTGALDLCMTFKYQPGQRYTPRGVNTGGSYVFDAGTATGWLTAVDANTGAVRWRYKSDSAMLGGVTPTAGGLILTGDNAGNFLAFDSDTGKVLDKVPTDGAIGGGVVTYLRGKRQYVAMATGNTSFPASGLVGQPTIVVMALNADALARTAESGPSPSRGRQLFQQMCSTCHGVTGDKIGGRDLRTVGTRLNQAQLEKFIQNPAPPMPRLFPPYLKGDDLRHVQDLAAFLATWHEAKD